ncbi:MAG: hypothetical protein FGM54_00475 [Chitinophagaceae bacterium]|nr:hypothetical protein [Chitinophagaceae bacterium]
MELPQFLLGDNTDFPEDIFIIHLGMPRCIINLKNDDIELLEEADELSEAELRNELERIAIEATLFYDREMERYEGA